jgi:hypothetical protein
MTWEELLAGHPQAVAALTDYRGTLRRVRPIVLDRDAESRTAAFLADNAAARRFPGEHQRIAAEDRAQIEAERYLAAGHARHVARQVRALVDEGRALIERTRRDTAQTFPDALDSVSADGMIMLGLLRTSMLPLLAGASAATLLDTYQSAVARKDARGMVEAEIIEDLIASGVAIAAAEQDLPIAKQLRELVSEVQTLRLPSNLPDLDGLLDDLDRLDSRAILAKVDPLVNDAASAAFEAQHGDIIEAGRLTDADDQAALHEDIRRAS